MARKRFWILPEFQSRMIKQWALLAISTTVLSQIITLAFVWYQDNQSMGKYFYIDAQAADSPIIINPISISLHHIILPAVLAALVMGFVASIVAGIYYSHRLAGPIYHIRKTIKEAQEGTHVQPIMLRKNDEFKDLAEDINRLLKMKV